MHGSLAKGALCASVYQIPWSHAPSQATQNAESFPERIGIAARDHPAAQQLAMYPTYTVSHDCIRTRPMPDDVR